MESILERFTTFFYIINHHLENLEPNGEGRRLQIAQLMRSFPSLDDIAQGTQRSADRAAVKLHDGK